MKKNEDILKERVEALDKVRGPRVGDWLIHKGNKMKMSRITYIWRDEHNKILCIQDGGAEYGGFYLGDGYASYSGGLESGIKSPFKLKLLRKRRKGRIWFFDGDIWGADRGVYFEVPFRVYRVV